MRARRRRRAREQPKQLSRLHVERVRDAHDVDESDVPFRAFDLADVVAIETGELREALLREISLDPQLAEAFAEEAENLVAAGELTGGSPVRAQLRVEDAAAAARAARTAADAARLRRGRVGWIAADAGTRDGRAAECPCNSDRNTRCFWLISRVAAP